MNISGVRFAQPAGGSVADNGEKTLERELKRVEQEWRELGKKRELSKDEMQRKQELEKQIASLRLRLSRMKVENASHRQKEAAQFKKAGQDEGGMEGEKEREEERAASNKKTGRGEYIDRYL